jgi:hypothetical protein
MAGYKSPELDEIGHHLDGMMNGLERYRDSMRSLQRGDLRPRGRYYLEAQEARANRLLEHLEDVVTERFRDLIDRTPSVEMAKTRRM